MSNGKRRPPHYFISHSWEHDELYKSLERLIGEHRPDFINLSVPRNRRIYEPNDKIWSSIERYPE